MSIFTHLAISPSTSLRQSLSRYAIRAGRNSPDKEFRSFLLSVFFETERHHFCSALHVAMQVGLYLDPTEY